MNTPNLNSNLNNRKYIFYNYNMNNQYQQQLMQNYYYHQQNQQMQNQYLQQQLQNQYYQQQMQNQYHQQQLQNQYYQQQMQNQYHQQQMQNNFRQQHLFQLQNQCKIGQDLIDQNKNECNKKKDELKLENSKSNKDVKNEELKLEISEEEYLKSNVDIKNEYAKCTNNNCSNPSFYHLRKKIFYIDSKNKLFCRSCFKPGMKGMHGTLCCEDSSNLTPQLCFSSATYGYAGGKPVRCTLHKLNNMINVNVSLCQFINPNKKRCKKKAMYGFSRRERCEDHKAEGMKMKEFRKNKTKK